MNFRTPLIVVALLASVAIGFLAARAYEQSQSAKRTQAAELRMAAEREALRNGAEQWSAALAKAEGEAILRSFVAGIAPVVLAGRGNSMEISGTSLLRLAGVQGVTILRADGKTLYASDAKLTVTDSGNAQTRWALTATDFMSRDGARAGITEMSLPVTDRGTVLAIVWLEYDSSRVREQHRPASMPAS